MCEPITLSIATGLAVAGTLAQTASAFKQAQFQQSMARRQADMSSMAAGDALLRGQNAGTRLAMRGSSIVGAQKAAAAASGVDVASGSSAQGIGATEAGVALDVSTAQNNAAREAWGYETEATNQNLRASEYGSAATGALVGGGLSAAGSALGGAAKVYEKGQVLKDGVKSFSWYGS